MYMSYCRFEGTKMEMNVCINDVYEHLYGEAEYEVSDNEIRNFRQMVYDMVTFLHETDILDEEGEVDENALDDVCEKMTKAYTEEEDY